MAQFQELIKNFDRIRDYMRQFYVYGFKVRGEFTEKSARTYDNERRRIESWLKGYVTFDYTAKGKQVSISADSRSIASNPLYAAWKAKSFTDNDLLLHFFILFYLAPKGGQETDENADFPLLSCSELADRIASDFGLTFDAQTVRLKLKEYELLGLLISEKRQKSLCYRLAPASVLDRPEFTPLFERLIAAISFFSEAVPFGFVGNTILDRENRANTCFQFKHHFMVHTLEDGILYPILQAIRQGSTLEFENHSRRSRQVSRITGMPLQIFASTRTGRRYVCLYSAKERRFMTLRLDCIARVQEEPGAANGCRETSRRETFRQGSPRGQTAGELMELLEKNKPFCFGVSFGSKAVRLEEICLRLHVDEQTEPHILERLYREGKGGEVLRIRRNEYLYSGTFFDVNEMLSWVKTFTGRIMDIQCSNEAAAVKVISDWKSMYRMYAGERNCKGFTAGEKK